MLKKIKRVRRFGIFEDFTGDGVQPFEPINVIYGPNYSGKTTLSRIFRCLETNTRHPDYGDADVVVEDDAGVSHGPDTGTSVRVSVYNEDFRKQHLRWDEEDGISPILLIGAEGIGARDAIEREEAAQTRTISSIAKVSERIDATERAVEEGMTDSARRISQDLSLSVFSKVHLKRIVNNWSGQDEYPLELAEEALETLTAKVNSVLLPALPSVQFDAKKLNAVVADAKEALHAQIGVTTTIQRLVERPDIAQWVGTGLQLHGSAEQCEFCLNPLTNARKRELNEHFSEEYSRLMGRLASVVERLEAAKPCIDMKDYPATAFYTALHTRRADVVARLQSEQKKLVAGVDAVINLVNEKMRQPFDIIELNERELDTMQFCSELENLHRLVVEHNRQTDDFAAEKQRAIDLLIGHRVARDMRALGLFRLRRVQRRRKVLKARIKRIDDGHRAIVQIQRARMHSASAGAMKLNDTLARFFGNNRIAIEATPDDRFRLMRGTEPAHNLSEGERTAIAFCYFITRLEHEDATLAGTIVYIDDPMSSLDSNHLHHMNAFMETLFLKDMGKREGSDPRYVCVAQQLFISTHNSEFFHLIWEWANIGGKNQKIGRAFMVERRDELDRATSALVDCPASVIEYPSLYPFYFHQLIRFLDTPIDDAATIFNIGNILRRFLEGFLHYRYLETYGIGKLDRIITDIVDCKKVQKFAHSQSHGLRPGTGLPSSGEARRLVNLAIIAIKTHDPVHYGALVESLPSGELQALSS